MNLQIYFYLTTISSTFYSIKKCIGIERYIKKSCEFKRKNSVDVNKNLDKWE